MNQCQFVSVPINGIFKELLCLSHKETCLGADGQDIVVREGMTVTAFDEDVDDDGKPDNLIASGTVERPPERLRSNGSRWVLKSTTMASGMNPTCKGQPPKAPAL